MKKWFDPVTTSKIFILPQHDVLSTLSSFIEIEDIPRKYGGKLDFQFGKSPNLDPKIRQHLSIEPTADAETLFLTSPIRWIDAAESGEDGEMTALSVGALNGKQRKERVAVLHALATRVATHSSALQSQRTETTPLPSRPVTSNSLSTPQSGIQSGTLSNGHTTPQSSAASMNQAATKQNHAIPNGYATPSKAQPTSTQSAAPGTDISTASLQEQQHPLANSNNPPPQSKPQITNMPPPPIDLERKKTDFFTPASDASELKQLS